MTRRKTLGSGRRESRWTVVLGWLLAFAPAWGCGDDSTTGDAGDAGDDGRPGDVEGGADGDGDADADAETSADADAETSADADADADVPCFFMLGRDPIAQPTGAAPEAGAAFSRIDTRVAIMRLSGSAPMRTAMST